ncbi:MAG: hypothetical protein ACKV19_16525 [Verrucomicrobiales bacterium]
MARAVSRPLPPRPVAVLPRWTLAAAGIVTAIIAAAALLWHVNRTNQRLQAEHRLVADPVLGLWLAEMRRDIETFEKSGGAANQGGRRLAEAVWLGRVRAVDFTTRQGEGPRLSDVILDPAHLMAGRRSPLDPRRDGAVRVSVLGHQWPQGEPRAGESWVFAVYRINKGNNVAHAAHRAP